MAKTISKPRRRQPAAHDDEDTMTATAPTTPKKTTILELATKMDAAVRDVETRRQAVDVARVALDSATQEYSAAIETLTTLRADFQTLMDDVLSVGGTVHVAQP
jgi:hypothetical protein